MQDEPFQDSIQAPKGPTALNPHECQMGHAQDPTGKHRPGMKCTKCGLPMWKATNENQVCAGGGALLP